MTPRKASWLAWLKSHVPTIVVTFIITAIGSGLLMWRELPLLEAADKTAISRIEKVEQDQARTDQDIQKMYEMKGTLDALLAEIRELRNDLRAHTQQHTNAKTTR